jgi:hypothetical protein
MLGVHTIDRLNALMLFYSQSDEHKDRMKECKNKKVHSLLDLSKQKEKEKEMK